MDKSEIESIESAVKFINGAFDNPDSEKETGFAVYKAGGKTFTTLTGDPKAVADSLWEFFCSDSYPSDYDAIFLTIAISVMRTRQLAVPVLKILADLGVVTAHKLASSDREICAAMQEWMAKPSKERGKQPFSYKQFSEALKNIL